MIFDFYSEVIFLLAVFFIYFTKITIVAVINRSRHGVILIINTWI